MKKPFIKNRNEFDKIAPKYGFVKRYEGEIYEHWFKQNGKVELHIFRECDGISIFIKGISVTISKTQGEKYLKDILDIIEWR